MSDRWSIEEAGELEPRSAFGMLAYLRYGFYFAYASALGRCPAPGEGTPE